MPTTITSSSTATVVKEPRVVETCRGTAHPVRSILSGTRR
jgi:hypothetical protein